MMDERWTVKDLEGCVNGIIVVASWTLPGVTEENRKNIIQDTWCQDGIQTGANYESMC